MVAPMVNPYESRMTKEERRRIWGKWTIKKKLSYQLARKFPRLLPYFYRKSFLSGKHGQIDKWLSLSLGSRVSRIDWKQNIAVHLCMLGREDCMAPVLLRKKKKLKSCLLCYPAVRSNIVCHNNHVFSVSLLYHDFEIVKQWLSTDITVNWWDIITKISLHFGYKCWYCWLRVLINITR